MPAFTCDPTAVMRTGPASPKLGASSMPGTFCSAANSPGPSTVQTEEPVGMQRSSLFAGVPGFSHSAAQGQGVGMDPPGSAVGMLSGGS